MAVLVTNYNGMSVLQINFIQDPKTVLTRSPVIRVSLRLWHQANYPAVRMILLAWFDHLEECFSYKEFLFQKFSHLRKPVAPLLKTLNK